MRARSVVPGSMAEAAGVEAGDRILRIAEIPIHSAQDLRRALRRAGSLDEIAFAFERGGSPAETLTDVQRLPSEIVAGHEVLYGELDRGDARLRTIITRPKDAGRSPALLFVQGISCESVDFGATPAATLGRLIHAWAAEGFVTMRLEKRGVGDSEGEDCTKLDFDTEVADFDAALTALAAQEFVDPDAIFVFGHSVGGMIAPLIDAGRLLRGRIVYGTSTVPWFSCMEASTARQLELHGATPAQVALGVENLKAKLEGLLREDAVELVDGRCPAFHRQLQWNDLRGAWRRVAAPVLVIHGEYDWVVGADEGQEIVDLVNRRASRTAEFLRIAEVDHLFTRHDDLATSLQAYGQGDFDTRVVADSAAWMRRAMQVA